MRVPPPAPDEIRVCSDIIIETWLIGSVGSWSGLRAAHRPSEAIDRHRLEAPLGRFIDLDRGWRRQLDFAHEPAALSSSVRRWVSTLALIPGRSALQPGKAARTISQLAQDEHRPPLADQLQRVREPARVVVAPSSPRFFEFWLVFLTSRLLIYNLRRAKGKRIESREGGEAMAMPRMIFVNLPVADLERSKALL